MVEPIDAILSLSGVTLTGIIAWILKRIGWLKRFKYFVFNERFSVTLSGRRDYEIGELDLNRLAQAIVNQFNGQRGITRIYDKRVGANFIDLTLKDYPTQYHIEIQPNIEPCLPEGEKCLVTVLINAVGTLEFRYRESERNNRYIFAMEALYAVLESEYHVSPKSSDIGLMVTREGQEEKWQECESKVVDGANVCIGKHGFSIHSSMPGVLNNLLKRNFTSI